MKSLGTHIALVAMLERERLSRRLTRSEGVSAILGLLGVAGLLFGAYVLEEIVVDRLMEGRSP